MEAFAVADHAFDFGKNLIFTDDEIKQALQKDLDTSSNVFTMADGTVFDFNNFFADDLSRTSTPTIIKPDQVRDQPVASIEIRNDAADTAPTVKAEEDIPACPEVQPDAPNDTSATKQETTAQVSSSTELPDMTGLKNNSTDPLLFNFENMDDFFAMNDQAQHAFDEPPNTMPTLASPFQPPTRGTDTSFDFSMKTPESSIVVPPPQDQYSNSQHLLPPGFPMGRRRSQTVPPDFEPGMSFQRRMGNGTQIPINRTPHSQQSYPLPNSMRTRVRYGPEPSHMTTMPRSYPVTPPSRHPNPNVMLHQSQHEYMGPSRPQSLNPDLRMSLMSRGRDLSPNRDSRRANKRQKQSHDRQVSFPGTAPLMHLSAPQDVDLGAYGLDQAMVGVEFMLRDAMEKLRYGRNEELERYVLLVGVLAV